jgi:hypothetical protein
MPSRSWSATSSTLTTIPSISNGTSSRSASSARKRATTSSVPVTVAFRSLVGNPHDASAPITSAWERIAAAGAPSTFATA